MASKNRRNKVKFKLTKELVILVVALLAILTATIIMALPSNAAKTLEKYNDAITEYNSANSTSYSTLPEEHVFKEISFEKLVNKKNSDEYTYVFYGSFSQGAFVENLSKINTQAKEHEIKTVYLFFCTWVEEQDDINSIDFNNEAKEKNALLNESKDKSQDEFDMVDITEPALLVFKSGTLIFNTQTYVDNDEYSWSNYINKALTLEKASSNN
ncbi:MAG: hypothetical protein ACI35S_01195 [Anaeroplasma sp.]